MTRALPAKPTVDKENPLWCPKISSKKFLSHIAREVDAVASPNDSCPTFAMKLSRGLRDITNDSDTLEARETTERPIKKARKAAIAQETTLRPKKHLQRFSVVPRPLRAAKVSSNPVPWRPSFAPDLTRARRTSSYSDARTDSEADSSHEDLLLGRTNRIKSTDTYDSASFILSDRAEALTISANAFQTSEASVPEGPRRRQPLLGRSQQTHRARESDGFSVPEGDGDIISLVKQLDAMFRGSRLEQRLSAIRPTTHQEIIDYLSEQGLLTRRSLSLFRGTHIGHISMTESLDTAEGLNEGAQDALKVFGQCSPFVSLTTLDLSGAPLPKAAVKLLVSLPALTELFLDNTEIDDSCVFPLTALRSPLRNLTLSENPGITDAALVALPFLEHLTSTDLTETSVTISGLRDFAHALDEKKREFSLRIPADCWEYMNDLESQYCVDYEVKFPIISQPSQCHGLTLTSIKQNLKIHSAVNKDISLRGGEAQLRSRLEEILTTREGDLRLQKYLES
ncbi:hypothetical protein FRB90_010640 [Tulasnella sp. 427]|nr:hypothetical protein FRB90_010640 [Tulasnella sp. 427]